MISLWGIALKEWKGAGLGAHGTANSWLVMLVASTAAVGYATISTPFPHAATGLGSRQRMRSRSSVIQNRYVVQHSFYNVF
jgi:hypothetical protein